MTKLDKLKEDFYKLRDPKIGEERILKKLAPLEKNLKKYLSRWLALSREAKEVYPSQGLLLTPYDRLSVSGFRTLKKSRLLKTLRHRMFFLEMFNHSYRIHFLDKVNKRVFKSPKKVECRALTTAFNSGLSLSIRDIGSIVNGSQKARISRTERYGAGPFVKLGRQGRALFTGSANPDVWGTSTALATMAACHCLATIPRNGLMYNLKRQSEVAHEAFEILEELREVILKDRPEESTILKYWRGNVAGVLEPEPEKALTRASALFKTGVKAFRIYSPEPGIGPIITVKALRKEFRDTIEIFAGQIVDVTQAKRTEEVGADGIFVGIGGGGRCTTGVRSGTVIDWPELVWRLRGEIKIPVVVEGGASDHAATTLLLGGSGISVSRIAAGGTIESPGGILYCVGKSGKLFKPYGGEASARAKFAEGKMLPFGIPSFVEGETTRSEVSYFKSEQPTLAYNLHLLTEDAILALVFRGVKNVYDLHDLDPLPLRHVTALGRYQIYTH
ncbi:IMP dehydrogenase [Candidatus Woesebacteria bacterium]|nr:IMP dehydrogenase [Candidatus Woesebacteria bacterium]